MLVEPLPRWHDKIRTVRPRDVLVEGAVGFNSDTMGVIKIKGAHGGGSYLTDPKWSGTPHCVDVKLYNINFILETYCKTLPSFISIDTEGNDLNILRTMDFDKFPVPIICAEIDKRACRGIYEFMESRGYHWIARTLYNAIFVRN